MAMQVRLRYAIGGRQIASHGLDAEEVCKNLNPVAARGIRNLLNVPLPSLLDYALGDEWQQHTNFLNSE